MKKALIIDSPEKCVDCPLYVTFTETEMDYGCGCDDCADNPTISEIDHDICIPLDRDVDLWNADGSHLKIDKECPLKDYKEK